MVLYMYETVVLHVTLLACWESIKEGFMRSVITMSLMEMLKCPPCFYNTYCSNILYEKEPYSLNIATRIASRSQPKKEIE